MPSFVTEFLAEYGELLAEGLGDTLAMLFVSTAIAYVLGIVLGVVLYLTAPGSLRPMPVLNAVLGWVVNIGRSLPFIIFSYSLKGTDSARSNSTFSGYFFTMASAAFSMMSVPLYSLLLLFIPMNSRSLWPFFFSVPVVFCGFIGKGINTVLPQKSFL